MKTSTSDVFFPAVGVEKTSQELLSGPPWASVLPPVESGSTESFGGLEGDRPLGFAQDLPGFNMTRNVLILGMAMAWTARHRHGISPKCLIMRTTCVLAKTADPGPQPDVLVGIRRSARFLS